MKLSVAMAAALLVGVAACKKDGVDAVKDDDKKAELTACEKIEAKLVACDADAAFAALECEDADFEAEGTEQEYLDAAACLLACYLEPECATLAGAYCGDEAGNTLEDCIGGCEPRFLCDDGSDIAIAWKCDGDEDCPDASDESDCELFMCDDGSQIVAKEECNYVSDCSDGSDEHQNCPGFACVDGSRVIRPNWQCDYVDDCADGSDEVGCPMFACLDGEEIRPTWECDGYADCEDGSDEHDSCPPDPTKFTCADESETISATWVCDLEEDCADGSDEVDCPAPFTCGDGGLLRPDRECDGTVQCEDGSDEHGTCPYVTICEAYGYEPPSPDNYYSDYDDEYDDYYE